MDDNNVVRKSLLYQGCKLIFSRRYMLMMEFLQLLLKFFIVWIIGGRNHNKMQKPIVKKVTVMRRLIKEEGQWPVFRQRNMCSTRQFLSLDDHYRSELNEIRYASVNRCSLDNEPGMCFYAINLPIMSV